MVSEPENPSTQPIPHPASICSQASFPQLRKKWILRFVLPQRLSMFTAAPPVTTEAPSCAGLLTRSRRSPKRLLNARVRKQPSPGLACKAKPRELVLSSACLRRSPKKDRGSTRALITPILTVNRFPSLTSVRCCGHLVQWSCSEPAIFLWLSPSRAVTRPLPSQEEIL